MDCIDVLKAGVGRDLTENELVKVMEHVKKERRRVQVAGLANVEGALEQALKEQSARVRIEEIAQKRAAMLNFARTTEAMDFVLSSFGDRPKDGLDALVSGYSFARAGARDSVEARQNGLANSYTDGFMADVEALGHTKLLNSGVLDKEIARALWSMERGGYTGPAEALELAGVIRKWQDRAREDANAAGAFIGRQSDYIVRQSHEGSKIKRAGFAKWRDAILPELDLDRTLDPDGPSRKAIAVEIVNKQERAQELELALTSLKKDVKGKVLALRGDMAKARAQHAAALGADAAGGKAGKPLREQMRASHAAFLTGKRADLKGLAAEYKSWIVDSRLDYRQTKKEIRELLRVERSFKEGGQSVDDFLYGVWQGLSSGEHLKYSQGPLQVPGKRGIGSAAKKLSHERVLHFKDADAWFRYNEQFGAGNLREAFLQGVERQARGTALMQVLGPNAANNWETMLAALKKHYTQKGRQAELDGLRGKERVLRNRLKEVDGSLNIGGGSDALATAGVVLRGVESMAKLGGVLLSSVADVPLFSSEFAHQGYGFFRPMLEGIQGLVRGKSGPERLAVLAEIGIAKESMLGALAGKFAGDELPGRMSKALRIYFKLNMLTWWTDAWRESAGLMMSHGLAMRRGMDWDALAPELSRTLSLYGIDHGKWNILRQMDVRRADGKAFMTPEGLRALPEALFEAYLTERGVKPTATRVRNLQDELAQQLRGYFRDRVDYAVLQPDSKTRATLRQGTAAGTVAGEALRFFAQFKAFPTSMLQRVWGREVYGRGASTDNFAKALLAGNGELRGMARLFLMTTLFGYGSMTAKQLIAGREPRDPRNPRTWAAAAVQGGALGVYGDFLFGEMRRSRGGGIAATVSGPVWSSMEQVADIGGRVKEGDSLGAASLRVLLNHVPGNNLFYIRPVFDHAIGYELFEMLSPGYQSRVQSRAKKEHGQDFWLRPGSASII